MKRLLSVVSLFCCCFFALAQAPGNRFVADKGRILFHDKVDAQQQKIKDLDGKKDDSITLSHDPAVNSQLEFAFIDHVDALQKQIEQDSLMSHASKVKYILGLETLLNGYRLNVRKTDFPVSIGPELVDAYDKAMALDRLNKSIEPIII